MNNLKEIDTEKLTCSYFDYIIKIVEFDFNNTLLDKKSYENILIYTISYKRWLVQNLCAQGLMNQMDLLEFMMEPDI